MRILKWFLIILLIVFIVIQFIRPEKNVSAAPAQNDISTRYTVPADVKVVLDKACYDCHSNNTKYPWYSEIQPIAWWMADHVEEGKEHLNYNEFLTYSLRKQYHKMEETEEMVEENHMPLDSYLWMHRDAKLNEQEKQLLIKWSADVRKEMEAKYPMDSLVKQNTPTPVQQPAEKKADDGHEGHDH